MIGYVNLLASKRPFSYFLPPQILASTREYKLVCVTSSITKLEANLDLDLEASMVVGEMPIYYLSVLADCRHPLHSARIPWNSLVRVLPESVPATYCASHVESNRSVELRRRHALV